MRNFIEKFIAKCLSDQGNVNSVSLVIHVDNLNIVTASIVSNYETVSAEDGVLMIGQAMTLDEALADLDVFCSRM